MSWPEAFAAVGMTAASIGGMVAMVWFATRK